MAAIAEEAQRDPELVKSAPHNTALRRLDETAANDVRVRRAGDPRLGAHGVDAFADLRVRVGERVLVDLLGVRFWVAEVRQMRQYVYFCTRKCVSICTLVLVNH